MKRTNGKILVQGCIGLLALSSMCATAYTPPESGRTTYNFNLDWKTVHADPADAQAVSFDDSSWDDVSLPHTFCEDLAFRVLQKDLPSTTPGWYRKVFKVPAAHVGKKIFFEFEGVRQAAEVFVNGKWVGRHENGVMAFGMDVSDFVKFGDEENTIAIKISYGAYDDYKEVATGTPFDWNCTTFHPVYGGIPKNVYLHVVEKVYQTFPLYSNLKTEGVYIYAKQDSINVDEKTADIHVKAPVKNETDATKKLTVQTDVVDRDGKLCLSLKSKPLPVAAGKTKMFEMNGGMESIDFWNWSHGYLYDVYTIVKEGDSVLDVIKTQTGFRKVEFDNGVKINDYTINMMGYAERKWHAWPALGSALPPWMIERDLQDMLIGNSKVAHWMHVCPRVEQVTACDRIGMIQVMPCGNHEYTGKEGRQWEQRKELMRDAIIYNRNAPSIVFYEVGNDNVAPKQMLEMRAIRDQWDPEGGRYIGCRDMEKNPEAEYGGGMQGLYKHEKKPVMAHEYMRHESPRRWWDEYSAPYFHKTDGSYKMNNDDYVIAAIDEFNHKYWANRPGTRKDISSGGWQIHYSDVQSHTRSLDVGNFRKSGVVDPMRVRKDLFYANKVCWSGLNDAENDDIHIIGHWNYSKGTKKDVYVISNATKVELFINGTSVGFGKQKKKFMFTFKDVEWKPGTLTAVGYNAKDEKVLETSKSTAGAPKSLKLSLETGPTGLRANGSDVALVTAKVLDADGKQCPTDLRKITFDVKGPAEYRGGIGDSTGVEGVNENYILEKTLPIVNGITRVTVRSTREPGTITIKATADGVTADSITLDSHAVASVDGLSSEMPAVVVKTPLPFVPDEIPDPATYIHPDRIAIKSAEAGGLNAKASYDLDVNTRWKNSNSLKTAWINYELGSKEQIKGVKVRFHQGESKTFPVKITIGEKVVFKGNTKKGVIWNCFFNPKSGTNLKIEMTGPNSAEKKDFSISEIVILKEISYADVSPDPFKLNTITGAEIFKDYVSATVIVNGIDRKEKTPIFIEDASEEASYSMNGGKFVSGKGMAKRYARVRVKLHTGSGHNVTQYAKLNIGGRTAEFRITTKAEGDPEIVTYYTGDCSAKSKDVKKEDRRPGYEGKSYLALKKIGAWFEWDNIESKAGGRTRLSFRYADPTMDKKPCTVLVNGKEAGTVEFPGTASNTTWKMDDLIVDLKAGKNTIRLVSTVSSSPNFDKVEVTPIVKP